MKKINPTKTSAWNRLAENAANGNKMRIAERIRQDKMQHLLHNITLDGLYFDYSRNLFDTEILSNLIQLATECKWRDDLASMRAGEAINQTEQRAVLHYMLRQFRDPGIVLQGKNIFSEVEQVRNKLKAFAESFYTGRRKGYTGKKLRQIVNIGIGGSDLGPAMVSEALKPYAASEIEIFYVSNVDAWQIHSVLAKLNAEECLVIIASKTFTTQETMANAALIKNWFLGQHEFKASDIAAHFIALSTNTEAVKEFGIQADNMFPFWDWVGGRYSVWSSIGLSCACTIGWNNFEQFLKGAERIDQHVNESDDAENIPLIMALLGIWYRNFMGAQSMAVLPYAQQLDRFADWLQQTDMESNGKSVDRNGEMVSYATGPVVWGAPGTNGQHAFFQLLHQGTDLIPCDFIGVKEASHPYMHMNDLLTSNYIAQTQALLQGKTKEQVMNENKTETFSEHVLPFRVFEGNKPVNVLVLDKLDPYHLGMLMALYEYKIFIQGSIWNIYSFDQWGVELGKQLAGPIAAALKRGSPEDSFDPATHALVELFGKTKSYFRK